MKILYCGDPHATVDSLEEMWKLVHFIKDRAKEEDVDYICFLGDQYHNFSLVNLSVMNFWKQAFFMLNEVCPVIALVGNHDRTGLHNDQVHAMEAHESYINVVDKSLVLDNVLFVGYQHSNEEFLNICKQHSHINTVVCHQTFDGSVFENGFYAKDGINPALVPQRHIISGHIHNHQVFDKVFYMGSPRWRTMSDANTEKFLWVVTHSEGIEDVKKIDTKGVCKPIYKIIDDLKTAYIPVEFYDKLEKNAKYLIELRGNYREIEEKYSLIRSKIKSFDVRVARFQINESFVVKESDGLKKAFMKYLSQFSTRFGTKPEEIIEMCKDHIEWLRE